MTDRDARLHQFFGGYFNQDWDIAGAQSWMDVMNRYLKEHPRSQIVRLRGDLDSWLRETASGPNPERGLPAEFGCDYDPRVDRSSDREWVQLLVDFIDDQLSRG
jgi:hypothetical protein